MNEQSQNYTHSNTLEVETLPKVKITRGLLVNSSSGYTNGNSVCFETWNQGYQLSQCH